MIEVPGGVTAIPEDAFYGADNLMEVRLPESLETIGSYAFGACTDLRFLIVPERVSSIGNNAFSNCNTLRYVLIGGNECTIGSNIFYNSPKAVLYCGLNSITTIDAIDNDIPFIPSDTAGSVSSGILDQNYSGYFADTNAVSINGYVTFTIEYAIPESAWNAIDNPEIKIHIANNLELLESTLKVDNVLCTDYTVDEKELVIPIHKASGTIKYSAAVKEQDMLQSYALFTYTTNNNWETQKEIIGIVYEEMEPLTLDVAERTASATLQVSGVAPILSEVAISVNGMEVNTVVANRAGIYNTTVQLEDAAEGKAYVVSALCPNSSGEPLTASKMVMYQENTPALTEFKFYVDSNDSQMVDLYTLGKTGIKPAITHTGSALPHKFVIDFSNADAIDTVYVTSTRSNVKKTIEAVYDIPTGKYIASGFFDETDKDYVPGNIGIEYNLKHDDFLVGEDVDWDNLFNQLDPALQEAEVSCNVDGESMSGTVDLSKVVTSAADVFVEYSIKYYDSEKNSSYSDLYNLSKTEAKIFSYFIPGLDDKRYHALLDMRDPYTYTMIVADTSSAADNIFELVLSTTDKTSENYDTLFDISNNLSNLSTAANILYKTYGIYDDYDDLCSEIMQSSNISDKSAALEDAEELRDDQVMFTLMTTLLPLIAASGGTMAGPAAILGGLIGIMSAVSDYFWKFRIADILGGLFGIRWNIDPSGYVYDIDTNERLQGVTATAYCIEYDDSADFWDNPPGENEYGNMWNAAEFSQLNPQITDAEGRYAWDVPEGWWRVKYEIKDYETTWSEWLPVPPPQTEVNIGMKFIGTPAETYLKGDVNQDSEVNMDDVVALLNHVVKADIITDSASLAAGEVTNDTELNMDDVVKLLNYVVKAIDSLE